MVSRVTSLISVFAWSVCLSIVAVFLLVSHARGADQWISFDGGDGAGKGKHVVMVSGDEEYRSEEALPQLAKILSKHHGFRCTVVFAIDPKDGTIDPNVNNNIPGLEALKDADLLILFTRFRDLPDDQMKYLAEYIESGKPIIGLRTATHAFQIKGSPTYKQYSWNVEGGFGKKVLGETWVSHHGHHGKESTLGIVNKDAKDLSILRGIKDGDIWGPTDVYGVNLPLPGDSKTIVYGQVLEGMKPSDKPVEGKKNDPMMPLAWIKTYQTTSGKSAKVFTTTMGSSTDCQSAGLRRLLVNAVFWATGMEDKITPTLNVELVGEYHPLPFGFGGAKKGVKPTDLAK